MSNDRIHDFVRELHRSAYVGETVLSDGQLLERYLTQRDEGAFEVLVRRHAAMVMGVCRRILSNSSDAEDAFQATFLVLVRKAPSIKPRELVGHWLYGVAYRTAQKARVRRARQLAREQAKPRGEVILPEEPDDWHLLLDEELMRLPEKYRLPVVLCELQERSRSEVARLLGWPEGTVATRLAKARRILARRLERRGVTLTVGSVSVALSVENVRATVSSLLLKETLRVAKAFASGQSGSGIIPPRVAALTGGMLMSMRIAKLKNAIGLLIAVGVIGVGVGLIGNRNPADAQPAPGGIGTAPSDDPDPNAEAKANLTLPSGPAPVQILARIDDAGRVCLSIALPPPSVAGVGAMMSGMGAGGYGEAGEAYGGGSGFEGALGGGEDAGMMGMVAQPPNYQAMITTRIDRERIKVFDTSGKTIDSEQLPELLSKESPALLAVDGREVDRLHLRIYKPGTLVFVVPRRYLPFHQTTNATGPMPGAPGMTPGFSGAFGSGTR